ncbi:DNA polymerase III subunit theta [Enterobacter sp. KBR-315C3_2022]|uniref:DNA polymerase III subunit theta n=1 Tax=Enterobacter sp. KBR-315C3_2022 TaxID=3242494 RepID=UPI003526F64D
MSQFNIAAKSKDEQDKVAVDLLASAVAFKERMNMPVVPEVVAREQPEHLREYFMERVRHYRQLSMQLPNANDPKYIEMAEANGKPK